MVLHIELLKRNNIMFYLSIVSDLRDIITITNNKKKIGIIL
jgi:hypothetical protein